MQKDKLKRNDFEDYDFLHAINFINLTYDLNRGLSFVSEKI